MGYNLLYIWKLKLDKIVERGLDSNYTLAGIMKIVNCEVYKSPGALPERGDKP